MRYTSTISLPVLYNIVVSVFYYNIIQHTINQLIVPYDIL